MAWKAKLISADRTGIVVEYRELVSGDTNSERYGVNQFATKQELVAYCTAVISDLNASITRANQLATLLSSSLNTDIA